MSEEIFTYPWVDKEELKRQMARLFESLSIQKEPLGAVALQEKMSQVGLDANELSQAIIEAREE